MDNMRKIKNTYYSDFLNSQGKRVRKSLGKKLDQAKIKLAQLQADVDIDSIARDEAMPSQGKVFKSALNEFISSVFSKHKVENAYEIKKGGWNLKTHRQPQVITSTLKNFETHSGIKNVKDATLPQMLKFIADGSKQHLSGTVNKHVQFLKRFFSWCEDMDYVVKSPARGLKRLQTETPVRYHFQPLEISKILDNAGCFFDFYVFALATGLRACDMWNLDVNCFETDKDGNMFLKGFSNKTGENISIPLNEDAVKVVKRAKDKLFPNANEEMWRKALRRNLINNFDYAYARKHNIRLHTFRHTFAISALKAGMPKEAIQSYLGHSSLQTTEIYCNQMSKTQLLRYTDLIKVAT